MQACPFCAGEVAEGDTGCPHCGHQLTTAAPTAAKPTLMGALGCGLLAVLLVVVSLVLFFGLVAGGLLGG